MTHAVKADLNWDKRIEIKRTYHTKFFDTFLLLLSFGGLTCPRVLSDRWDGTKKRFASMSDSETWKKFDAWHPLFAHKSHNVKLSLSIDGFTLFSHTAAPYLYWSIFVILYNLPSRMRSFDYIHWGMRDEEAPIPKHGVRKDKPYQSEFF